MSQASFHVGTYGSDKTGWSFKTWVQVGVARQHLSDSIETYASVGEALTNGEVHLATSLRDAITYALGPR